MASTSYGTNIAFIEELYEKYRQDPGSVSESWQEFFQDYAEPGDDSGYETTPMANWQATPQTDTSSSQGGAATATAPATKTAVDPVRKAPQAQPKPATEKEDDETVVPLRGVASRIVENMESSLSVPTATSVRTIPVKVLEENRRAINNHLSLAGQPKTSYTHIIGWAIVRAIREYPRLNSSFRMTDGQPSRIDHEHVNLGLAIDVEKKDGSRSLVVPNVKAADTMDFYHYLRAYNEIVRKARNGNLAISDFEGTTISLTNPGTIGTVASVPRLMQAQGTIIATGMIGYPPEYSAMHPDVLADLGISKTMTMTSTYDHRIIQGAESGAFLARIHELLEGADEFYDEIFRDLRIPYAAMRMSRDQNRSITGRLDDDERLSREAAVLQLINAYRVRGHLNADLDPLEYRVGRHPELDPAYYGLTIWDLDREFITGGLCGKKTAKLRDILDTLRETYCGKLGSEYMHIQDPEQKKWLQERMEPTRNNWTLEPDQKRRVLMKLNDAEAFERFLHTKFVGHKRFSLEGAETVIPMLDYLLNLSTDDNVSEVVMGMAHRGRLNVLANILGKSYERIFNEFEGDLDPNTTQGSGDVKYHLGASGSHVSPSGKTVRVTLASNPSHLEAVDPIVEGMTRAHQKLINDRDRSRVIPILLHGDAAFSGQGVVAETLNLSQLKGYRTGGTVHIVINNQIGFTTGPADARSSVYATDVAKMVQAPIFHVNGDDPEAAVRAIRLAYDFRQRFHKDVVIDLICYRRHGHNEADDPSLTQPRMYQLIKEHRSVRKLYTETLLRKGDLDPEEAERWLDSFRSKMEDAFDRIKEQHAPPMTREPLWTDEAETGFQNEPSAATGVERARLETIGQAITMIPEGFTLHPKLKNFLQKRRAMIDGKERLDWATAEALSFGSLLLDGFRVRISGQDSGRGTFSQRHAIMFDYSTGQGWVPLNALARNHLPSLDLRNPDHKEIHDKLSIGDPSTNGNTPVNFSVYDSHLSEYGVMGFEYGYSVADPGTLVCWEAQFGDFMNGAQIIIDQFIASAEEKWGQHSGLVLLLPHGYEGQGPEHSSARLERFLILCAEGNIQVVNATTPAQYFHVLRRQMTNEPRKPLIILTPKSLLRHPAATSEMTDLVDGRFEPVLDDPKFLGDEAWDSSGVQRIILTAGKIYYDLTSARDGEDRRDVAIVRLEQFYPWPQAFLEKIIAKYGNAEKMVWVQEEPRNMGGWDFVDERLIEILGGKKLEYAGRPLSASPATGSYQRHEAQQNAIVDLAVRK